MSEFDHKANAEATLFADRQYRDERTLMEAQVSATLYLAEQQRIANVIAMTSTSGITEKVADVGFANRYDFLEFLKKALGLA